MMMTEKKEIKAVHMADLSGLLEKYNQLDDFNNNNLKCGICSDTLATENIGSLKLKESSLIFSCNKPSCYSQMVKKKTD